MRIKLSVLWKQYNKHKIEAQNIKNTRNIISYEDFSGLTKYARDIIEMGK